MTQVAVIGPGALGCLFAARLSRSGVPTRLIDYDAGRAELLRRQGITVEGTEETLEAHPEIDMDFPVPPRLVLVLTKAHATGRIALPPESPVLTLQNGLGNAETLAERCGEGRVLAGATTEAVTWLAPGRVRHVARGTTSFGSWTTCPTDDAVNLLRQAGFDVALTDNPRQVIWEKAVVNAAINPLTALSNLENGALLDKPEIRNLLHLLAEEAAAVALAEGFSIGGSAAERAEKACDASRHNISSMLQDIRKNKQTEIEAISGEILRRAAKAHVPAPQTALVYHLVRALEFL